MASEPLRLDTNEILSANVRCGTTLVPIIATGVVLGPIRGVATVVELMDMVIARESESVTDSDVEVGSVVC